MIAMIKREHENDFILIFDGSEKMVDKATLLKLLKVDGIIRIQEKDFAHVSFPFVHFNLEYTGHEKGKKYALLKILRPGYFTDEEEKLPLLDIASCIKAECIDVKDQISYKELQSYLDQYSSPATIEGVKGMILERYTQSLPKLSKNEIVDAGVAITVLAKG